MALAITLSELAWIFKRELAIMIPLCLFSSCFYFSQGRGKKQKIELGLLCQTHLPAALGRSARRKAVPTESFSSNPAALINVFCLQRGELWHPGSAPWGLSRTAWDVCLGLWKGEVVSLLDAYYRKSNGAGRLNAVRLQTIISAGKYFHSLLYLQSRKSIAFINNTKFDFV